METKIKIKVGALVADPVYGMQNGAPVIIGYEFPAALRKLADDPMPIKDRYNLGKAVRQVAEVVRLYDKSRYDLIEKLGKKMSALLAEDLAELQEKFHDADGNPKVQEARAAQIKRLEDTIAEMVKNPSLDSSKIPDDEKEAMERFNAELKTLQDEDFEFERLSAKIVPCKDSKLTGNEMASLDAILAPPTE